MYCLNKESCTVRERAQFSNSLIVKIDNNGLILFVLVPASSSDAAEYISFLRDRICNTQKVCCLYTIWNISDGTTVFFAK